MRLLQPYKSLSTHSNKDRRLKNSIGNALSLFIKCSINHDGEKRSSKLPKMLHPAMKVYFRRRFTAGILHKCQDLIKSI